MAVDLRTGQRKWHFQLVHHPIWNFDNCCAPILADITVNGRAIKAVAQPSKQGFLYVFDRATGQPVWPIEERPAPASDIPGEKTSPTQPFPTKPPAYSRNYLRAPDDLIDYTPELRTQAIELLKRYKIAASPFVPAIPGNVTGMLGAIAAGTATNWPGADTIPSSQRHALTGNTLSAYVRRAAGGFSTSAHVSGTAGRAFRPVGPTCSGIPAARPVRICRRR